MSVFETVVRPFQSPEFSPAQKYLAPDQQSNPPLAMTFGRSGNGRTFGGSYKRRVSLYADQAVVEKATK